MKRSSWIKVSLFLVPALLLGGVAVAEKQPLMRAALGSLEAAKGQLEKATADKGGHRVKALEHVAAAIAEVKLGIEFDNKH